MKRRDLLLTAAASALGASAAAAALNRPWPKGQATPALDLPGFDGPRWSLKEGAGKVVLLNFWASWCEPCRNEMPTLELLATRFEKQGLLVMAVNFRETDAAIQRYLDTLPMSLPILRDADGATARAWGARAFPTSVLVGRDGRALFSILGEMDWNSKEAQQMVAALL